MSNRTLPTQQIGDFSITAVSDGYLGANLELLANIDPAHATQLQRATGISTPSAIHINCYLVRGRGRTVLIDAGAGGIKQWGGELQANLALAGVQPGEIDTVLLTHAHPDHIGGLLDASGTMAFANAELVVAQQEIEFWQNDGYLSQANERARGNFLFARQVFDTYRHQLRTFRNNDVLPGISALPLPGHTAGHCGYRLDSAGESLLVWGDVVHFPHIQITRPDVSIAFDQDPRLSATTRTQLLDMVSADRLLIAGMHLGEPGFARIERRGKAYQLAYQG